MRSPSANSNVANLVLWTDTLKLNSPDGIKGLNSRKKVKIFDHTIIVNSPIGANHTLGDHGIGGCKFHMPRWLDNPQLKR
ncbi:MAG: hypothetical protein IPQ18_14775 [Saprospiraceae bacterium]|nr:hypothetical protein [Saprospiraceae bacterium]